MSAAPAELDDLPLRSVPGRECLVAMYPVHRLGVEPRPDGAAAAG